MGYQRGRNAGITGLCDFPGFAAKFEATVHGYKKALGAGTRPRLGRGSNGWTKFRIVVTNGSILLYATLRLDGWPAPSELKGQTGTITVQFHTGRTAALTVLVDGVTVSLPHDKEQDTHDILLACKIIDAPAWTGWPGTQPTGTDPAKADQEQYEGTGKTYDPNALVSAATRYVDVWGSLADTDAAEEQKLADMVAAIVTPPMNGLKVRTASFQRDSIDGGTVVVTFGLTSTADDVLLPLVTYDIDPGHLNSRAQVAQFHDEPPPPNSVHPDDAQVLVNKHRHNLNDGTTLHVHQYGRRDSVQAVEEDNTVTVTDPNNLQSQVTAAKVNAAASLPAGYVLRQIERRDLNPTQYLEKHHGGLRDTIEDVTMPGTWTYTDPHGIDSKGFDTDVYTTIDGPPADPAAPAGQQIVGSRIEEIDRLHSQRRVEFAVLNSRQRVEFARQRIMVDARDLGSEEFKSELFTNGAPPVTPAAPAGLKFVDHEDQPVTPTQSVRVWKYAKADARDKIELRETFTFTDPLNLASRAAKAALDAVPALPPGFKDRGTRSIEVVPGHTLNVKDGGLRSTKDDVEMDVTVSVAEVEQSRITTVATEIDCLAGDTADSIAAAEFTARNNSSTFAGLSVKKLHDTKALLVVRTAKNDLIFSGSSRGGKQLVVARLAGGNVQVYANHVLSRGSGKYHVEVAPQWMHRVQMHFTVRRRKSQIQVPLFHSRIGKSNQSPFFGFDTGTVTYLGADVKANHTLSPVPAWIDYRFLYDSLGQFTAEDIILGWFETNANLAGANPRGWVNTAVFNWLAGPLPTDDFSVFTV